MITAFARLVRDELNSEIEMLSAGILSGNCQDFSEYRHSAGRLLGLERALAIVEEVEEKLVNEE